MSAVGRRSNCWDQTPAEATDILAISFDLNEHRCLRDRAVFDLAIDSKLRGCKVVKLKISNFIVGGSIRNLPTVIQQKTGKSVQFELGKDVRESLLIWLNCRAGGVGEFIFPSRIDRTGHMSTRQYARVVDEWVGEIDLNDHEYGTHSLRRTKAALIYKDTGNLRAVQTLLGHTKIETTVRYLSVDIDNILTLSERTEI